MKKLYERIDFVNDAAPDLNAANLNRMSKGLYDVDTRLSEIIPADDYAELAEETMENAEKARIAADNAEAIVGIGIATTTKAGIVKPDGRTIKVYPDGTIECINGGGGDYDEALSPTSENAPQNKAVTSALDNINVYVGSDGKIHFTDRSGADSVLNFSKEPTAFDLFKSDSVANNKAITYTKELEEGTYVVIPIRTFASNTGASNYRSLLTQYTLSGVDEVVPLHDTTAIYKVVCNGARTLSLVSSNSASTTLTGYMGVYVVKIG